MLFDASIGGTSRENTNEEVKILIENMCQNEYHSSERVAKEKRVLVVDTQAALLAQLEALTK